LRTPIDYFYAGFDGKKPGRLSAHQRRQLEMARNLDGIDDEQYLEAISVVVRALAGR
jgi:hypothetical protein